MNTEIFFNEAIHKLPTQGLISGTKIFVRNSRNCRHIKKGVTKS